MEVMDCCWMQPEVLSQQLLFSKDFSPPETGEQNTLELFFMNNAVFCTVTGIFKGCWVMNSSHYQWKKCPVPLFLVPILCAGDESPLLRRIRDEIINLWAESWFKNEGAHLECALESRAFCSPSSPAVGRKWAPQRQPRRTFVKWTSLKSHKSTGE